MLARAERLFLILRQLRGMTPHQRREAIKRRLGPGITGRVQRLKAAREQRQLLRVERRRGIEAAHRAFWSGPARRRGWPAVEARLRMLAQDRPEEMANFTAIGLQAPPDGLTLAFLAQHPLSHAAMAAALAAERTAPQPALAECIAAGSEHAAGFLVATAMTGDDAALAQARARMPAALSDGFGQFVESFGQRPAAAAGDIDPILRGLRHSGLRGARRHRLVIAENFDDPEIFLPLLRGAEQVTLLGLDDTFGKAAFADFQALPGVGEIVVEHIRSRITRFSAQYTEAHVQTRDAAIELAALVGAVPGLVPAGDLAHVELAIADYLFFQMLRLRAIEELLADPGFDHVVIATRNHAAGSGYVLTLAGVPGLTADPRVELISLARSVAQRSAFAALLPAILTGPRPALMPEAWLPAPSVLAAPLLRAAAVWAGELPAQPVAAGGAGSVLLATAGSSAYDLSTARYSAALAREFPTALAVCGGGAAEIQRELTQTGLATGATPFHLLRREYSPGPSTFARWMQGQLNLFCQRRGPQDRVAHSIACAPARLATNIIQAQVMHGLVLEAWFQRMAGAGTLPGLVALSAVRTAGVSQFAATARRHAVPTLALEAHGLNANYSRYAKVAADYYGVISGQFRTDAERGFAMPPGRTRVIGTPRIIARPARPPALARAEIAAALGHDFPTRPGGVVSFFCQPSAWTHVAQVWRMVLAVAGQLDLQVMLKPHPEETPSRIAQYRAVARQMQADERVQLVTLRPDLLIEASDAVLTGYSAAALDAAVLGRPVVCVTVGDAVYPVDQHEIARAPLVHDAAGLRQALQARLGNDAAAARAYAEFLAAEPQFAEGPDARLRRFVTEILAAPEIRPASGVPAHLFLDPPHPTFAV